MNRSAPRILYVTSHWPHAPSYGAQQRVLHLGRLLNGFGQVGLIVVSSEAADSEVRRRTREEFEVLRVVRTRPVDSGGWKGRLRHELDPAYLQTDPWAAGSRDRREVLKLMEGSDIVWVHTLKTANMLRIDRWPRSVLDIDDIPSHLYRHSASGDSSWSRRLLDRRMQFIWRRREARLADRFDVLAVCSENDQRSLGNGNAVVIPNGYPLPDFTPRSPACPPRVGFVGTMRWPANVDGVQWFIQRVWPCLKQGVPEARLRLAGWGTESFSNPDEDVCGLGFVEDLAHEISTWSLMAVPIRVGGGTRIKIAEAFALKCPLVSTSLGAYGYDVQHQEHLLLADTPDAFAEACAKLLGSPQEAERMARRSHRLFLDRWTWESYAPRVSKALDAAAEASTVRTAGALHGLASGPSGEGPAPAAVGNAALQASVVSGIAWSSLENWTRPILAFLVYSLLARLLGPKSFGLVALGLVYVTLVELVVTQAFMTTLVQRERLEKGHLDSAFLLSLLTAASLWLLGFLFADQAAAILHEPEFPGVLRWLSFYAVLSALSVVPVSMLTRKMAFRSLAFRNLASSAVGGAVGVTMAISGWGVWSLVGQQLSLGMTRLISLWWAVSWKPSLAISVRHSKDLVRFGRNISANNLLYFFVQRSDHSLVGYSFGAAVLGPYSLAGRIVQLLSNAVAGSFEAVALPALSRLQSEGERLRQAFYKFTEMQALIAFPAFAGLIALAPVFVPLFLGPRWLQSVPILQALALYGAIRVAMTFGHPFMLALGRPGLYLALYVVNASGAFLFCLIAAQFSAQAVAWAVVLNIALHSSIFLLVGRNFFSPVRFLRQLAGPGAAAGIMFILVVLLRDQLTQVHPLWALLSTIPAGMLTYGAAVWLLRRDAIVEAYRTVVLRG